MDQADVQKFADAHAKAVQAGDQAAVIGDIVPEALSKLGPVANALPNPVTSATVQSVEMSGATATVRITYAGADKSATVQSIWEERDGRPKITDATVV